MSLDNVKKLEKDFYEELISVKPHQFYDDAILIHEQDKEKGNRITHYSIKSDSAYRIEKW